MNAVAIKNVLAVVLILVILGAVAYCLTSSLRTHDLIQEKERSLSSLNEKISQEQATSQALALSIKDISSQLDKTTALQSRTASQLNDLAEQNSRLRQELQDIKDRQELAQKDSKQWQVDYVTTLMKMETALKNLEEQVVVIKKDADLQKIDLEAIDIAEIRQKIFQLKQNLEELVRAFSARGAEYVPQSLHKELLKK